MNDSTLPADLAAADAQMREADSKPWTDEDRAPPEPVEAADDTPPASAEAVEAEKPAEKPKAEPKAEEEDQPKFVRHEALHEERQKRKELQARLDALQAQFEKMTAPKPEPEPEMPDPVMDPDAYRQWTREQLQRRDQRLEAFERQQAETARLNQMRNVVAAAEEQFRAETPDYDEAVTYTVEARKRELSLFGVPAHEQARIIAQEAQGIIQAAMQNGMSPAEAAYQVAQARGWRKPEPKPEGPSEADKLAALEKAQRETRTIAGSSGGAAPSKYTAAQLASMSPKEIAKIPDEEFRRVMGG